MKLNIGYVHQGVEGTVVTLPADIIAWERTTGQKLAGLYMVDDAGNARLNIGVEDCAVMAHAALVRTEATTATFDKWIAGLDEIYFEPVPVDPTQPGA